MAHITRAFRHQVAGRLFKGELWLGTDLLKKANLGDDLEGHLSLTQLLGHDLFCLPVSTERSANEALGYRYFSVTELKEAKKADVSCLAAVVDGPFQRLADKKGLLEVLVQWQQARRDFARAYEQECSQVASLLNQCLELSIDAVVMADDLSGEQGPLIRPQDMSSFFAPFYARVTSETHSAHTYALFHSCGNIRTLIPHIVSFGFDGLAAIQHKANNLKRIREEHGAQLTLMGGIDADILEATEASPPDLAEFQQLVQGLHAGGGFILGSCCGLYAGHHLNRIRELYRVADEHIRGRQTRRRAQHA